MVKKATKGAKKKRPMTLNAHESVMGFVAYLTTRETPVILSAHHPTPPMPEILEAWAKANELPPVRKTYHKILRRPEGVDRLTNFEKAETTSCCPPPPLQAGDAVRLIIELLDRVPNTNRNGVIARVIKDRQDRLQYSKRTAKRQMMSSAEHLHDLQGTEQELGNILEGKFTVL